MKPKTPISALETENDPSKKVVVPNVGKKVEPPKKK
jgi:hypothetical protein